MTIPPKGSIQREGAELQVHLRRLGRALAEPMVPVVRWLDRQPWVIAFAGWSDHYWPRWLTFWNVMYAGVILYGLLLLAMVLIRP